MEQDNTKLHSLPTQNQNQTDFEFLRCTAQQWGTNDPTYLTYRPLTANPGNSFTTLKVIARDSLGNVGEAGYDSRNRPVRLREFTGRAPQPGQAEIDNNLVENAIRPTALGKKNFLFIGHPEAGWRSAVIYSVPGSCRRLGIDPHEYLRDVLRRLPDMKISQIEQITPAAWAKAKKSEARKKSL